MGRNALRNRFVASAFAIAAVAVVTGKIADSATAASADDTAKHPTWAYVWDPDFVVPPADNVPQRLSGSTAAFSWMQARDLFFAPSWHAEDHPPMPEVVARGRKPDVRACGSCHRAEGTGGPENASLAGLPVEYFVQQMADFKNGARKFSGPQRTSIALMMASAKGMTEAEVKEAATYFSA